MGSIGFGEVAFLVVLALLVFGPDKLPGIANTVGKAIGAVRREASGTLDELKRAAEFDEFRGVAQELRSTGQELRGTRDELRRGLSATGAALPASAQGARQQSAALVGPAPFDPDAT